MKLFEISSGALINPFFVTSVKVVISIYIKADDRYSVKYCDTGGRYQLGVMTSKENAEAEKLAFKEMLESISM